MRIQGLAGTAVSVAMVLSGAVRAEAEFRTDGLSGRQLKTWKSIVAVIEEADRDGQPLHPTLHRLYRELDSSAHAVRIVIPATKGSSAIGPVPGRVARVRRPARGLDHPQPPDDRPGADGLPGRVSWVTFETLGRAERYAQVFGHEPAHAAWALADPEHTRLVAGVQCDAYALARRAQTEGTAGEGFSGCRWRRPRSSCAAGSGPALAAEAAITEELRGQPRLSPRANL